MFGIDERLDEKRVFKVEQRGFLESHKRKIRDLSLVALGMYLGTCLYLFNGELVWFLGVLAGVGLAFYVVGR